LALYTFKKHMHTRAAECNCVM